MSNHAVVNGNVGSRGPRLFYGWVVVLTSLTLAWALGGSAGPLLAGYIFDLRQSYDLAFVAGGVLLILGAVAVYFWGSHRKEGR